MRVSLGLARARRDSRSAALSCCRGRARCTAHSTRFLAHATAGNARRFFIERGSDLQKFRPHGGRSQVAQAAARSHLARLTTGRRAVPRALRWTRISRTRRNRSNVSWPARWALVIHTQTGRAAWPGQIPCAQHWTKRLPVWSEASTESSPARRRLAAPTRTEREVRAAGLA